MSIHPRDSIDADAVMETLVRAMDAKAIHDGEKRCHSYRARLCGAFAVEGVAVNRELCRAKEAARDLFEGLGPEDVVMFRGRQIRWDLASDRPQFVHAFTPSEAAAKSAPAVEMIHAAEVFRFPATEDSDASPAARAFDFLEANVIG